MSIKRDTGGAMRGQRGSMRPASLAIGAILVLSSTMACTKAYGVIAMFKFKQANQAYVSQAYDRAAMLYAEAINYDPTMLNVYFYLGNSYDNLYNPGEKGRPENDAFLRKAVEQYALAVEKLSTNDPTQAKLKGLALQFLMAAYGAEKLDDPVKAESVIIQLIQFDPAEPANYFQLAKLYEDAGEYDATEKVYLAAKQAKPRDINVYLQLAGFYSRQGQFDKTIDAFEQRAQLEPENPEGFYAIGTQYWDQAYRGVGVREADKKTYVQKGIAAVDRALTIRPDYVEAMVYKNLLLRSQALLEKDPAKQQALIKQADTIRDKAETIRKEKATGVGD